MREKFLKMPILSRQLPKYGDFICYPKTPFDYTETDGVGICYCADPTYVLVWTIGKGGLRKLPFRLSDCRVISDSQYPRTEFNVKIYRQRGLMLDVNLQAV